MPVYEPWPVFTNSSTTLTTNNLATVYNGNYLVSNVSTWPLTVSTWPTDPVEAAPKPDDPLDWLRRSVDEYVDAGYLA